MDFHALIRQMHWFDYGLEQQQSAGMCVRVGQVRESCGTLRSLLQSRVSVVAWKCILGLITAFLNYARLEGHKKKKKPGSLVHPQPGLAWYEETLYNTLQRGSRPRSVFVRACVGLITEGLALIEWVAFLWPLWSVGITCRKSTVSFKFHSVCAWASN